MTGKILNLPGCSAKQEMPDLSPAFQEKWTTFAQEMGDCMDRAVEAGIPMQFIIGQLECVKADLLETIAMIGYEEE